MRKTTTGPSAQRPSRTKTGHRCGLLSPCFLILPIALAALAGPAAITTAVAEGLTLKVRIDGFKSDAGQAFVCLWGDATNFPKCEQGNSSKRVAVKISGGNAETSFDKLVEGKRYAVSVHHDQNGDGKVDKNAMGIALEGIGISGNPVLSMLTIGFAKNSFVMKPDLDLGPIHIKHMF